MRHHEKVYHDENYLNPGPVGTCIVCGLPIDAGDEYYAVEEGLVHADGGAFEKIKIKGRERELSCGMTYILGYDEVTLAEALGLERRE